MTDPVGVVAPGASGRSLAPGPGGPAAVPVTCRPVASAAELAAHHRIRRDVFVAEQAVFAVSDLDANDDRPDVARIVAWSDGDAVGTVRLFELDPAARLWQGDRLAVLPGFRRGVGARLVRAAVATAARAGGATMIAHVQPPNRHFFERLGWRCEGTGMYVGLPHLTMTIGL